MEPVPNLHGPAILVEEEDEEEEMEDKEFFPGDLSFSDEEEIDVGIEEEFLHPPLEHVINLFEEEEEQHQQEQQFNFGDLQDPAFPPNFIVPPPHLAAQPAHTQFTGEEGYDLMQHALAGILPPGIQNFFIPGAHKFSFLPGSNKWKLVVPRVCYGLGNPGFMVLLPTPSSPSTSNIPVKLPKV